jgi:heme exporter protein A
VSVALETASREATVSVEARALSHRYGRRLGLEPVSFTLSAPGIVAVTGSNGSGKSTLLRILAGLLRPSGGSTVLSVGGREVAPAERRLQVGYAAPELAFYEELSVAENLKFAAEARGSSTEEADLTVRAALTRVGLEVRASDRVAALSSGMKQRLRLAFAVLHTPKILLLDEPGSHMDEAGRTMLTGLVAQERRESLVVLATNDEREWRLAEQRIELRGGGLGHPA